MTVNELLVGMTLDGFYVGMTQLVVWVAVFADGVVAGRAAFVSVRGRDC